MYALGHDLLDQSQAESRSQPAGKPNREFRVPFRQVSNESQGGVYHLGRKSQRGRELQGQQQKFSDALWTQFRRVSFTISLERITGLEEAYPFKIFRAVDTLIGWLTQTLEVGSYQGSNGLHSLDEAAELNVMPALAMRHGRIGNPLKKMSPLLHGPKEFPGLQYRGLRLRDVDSLEVQAIEVLPHRRTALFAHMTQTIARCRHATKNGGWIGAIECQCGGCADG